MFLPTSLYYLLPRKNKLSLHIFNYLVVIAYYKQNVWRAIIFSSRFNSSLNTPEVHLKDWGLLRAQGLDNRLLCCWFPVNTKTTVECILLKNVCIHWWWCCRKLPKSCERCTIRICLFANWIETANNERLTVDIPYKVYSNYNVKNLSV